MRRLVHLSDLHFGALRPETLDPLLARIAELGPHMLVVSGDLTQRATAEQFQSARAFLESIACDRKLVVPGNHDIPLWNVWRRFVSPRARFDAYVDEHPFPMLLDDEVVVVGVNTARSLSFKNGRINMKQLAQISRRFRRAPRRALRVLTCHHPFVLPEGVSAKQRAGRSDLALARLVEGHVDLLLTGHRHVPWVSPLGTSVPTVHAGTSTSRRLRGVENSFNDILVEREQVTVRCFVWRPLEGHFAIESAATHEYPRDALGRL